MLPLIVSVCVLVLYFNHFAVGLKFHWQLLCQYSVYSTSWFESSTHVQVSVYLLSCLHSSGGVQ